MAESEVVAQPQTTPQTSVIDQDAYFTFLAEENRKQREMEESLAMEQMMLSQGANQDLQKQAVFESLLGMAGGYGMPTIQQSPVSMPDISQYLNIGKAW